MLNTDYTLIYFFVVVEPLRLAPRYIAVVYSWHFRDRGRMDSLGCNSDHGSGHTLGGYRGSLRRGSVLVCFHIFTALAFLRHEKVRPLTPKLSRVFSDNL